jgi:hypothetical protein
LQEIEEQLMPLRRQQAFQGVLQTADGMGDAAAQSAAGIVGITIGWTSYPEI